MMGTTLYLQVYHWNIIKLENCGNWQIYQVKLFFSCQWLSLHIWFKWFSSAWTWAVTFAKTVPFTKNGDYNFVIICSLFVNFEDLTYWYICIIYEPLWPQVTNIQFLLTISPPNHTLGLQARIMEMITNWLSKLLIV